MYIREAEEQDFDELKIFYTRMNEVINVRNNGFNPDNAVYPSDDMISTAISSGGQIIGIQDGKIVAACILTDKEDEAYTQVKWNVNAGENEFWIFHALRVAPEYEGRGFAKQMLAFVIDLAPHRGRKAIRLDVLEGYWVEHLYQIFGFKYVDTVEMVYEDIGHPKRFRLLEREI